MVQMQLDNARGVKYTFAYSVEVFSRRLEGRGLASMRLEQSLFLVIK